MPSPCSTRSAASGSARCPSPSSSWPMLPAIRAHASSWSRSARRPLRARGEMAARGSRALGYAGPPSPKATLVYTQYIITDMYAKAVQGSAPEDAVRWAEGELKGVVRELASTVHEHRTCDRGGWRRGRGSAPAEWDPLVLCAARRAAIQASG